MKTLNEVIKANECCDHGELDSKCEDCSYNGIGACCAERESDALHYLKKYRDNYEARNDQVKRYQKAAQQCEEVLKDYIALKQIALRQYCVEAQDNLPLTWDELKQMEGKPIWVEQCNTDIKGWLLILRTNFDVITCTTRHGNSFYLYKSSYGERGEAYRKERDENA